MPMAAPEILPISARPPGLIQRLSNGCGGDQRVPVGHSDVKSIMIYTRVLNRGQCRRGRSILMSPYVPDRGDLELLDGYAVSGVILSDQLKSLDWRSRKVKFIERASSDVMAMASVSVLAKASIQGLSMVTARTLVSGVSVRGWVGGEN